MPQPHTQSAAQPTQHDALATIKQQMADSMGDDGAGALAEIDKVQSILQEVGDPSANPALFFQKLMGAFEEKKPPLAEAFELLELARDVMVLPGTPAINIAELVIVGGAGFENADNLKLVFDAVEGLAKRLKVTPQLPQIIAASRWCQLAALCVRSRALEVTRHPQAAARAAAALQACRMGVPQISARAADAIKKKARAAASMANMPNIFGSLLNAAVQQPEPAPKPAPVNVTPPAPPETIIDAHAEVDHSEDTILEGSDDQPETGAKPAATPPAKPSTGAAAAKPQKNGKAARNASPAGDPA